MYPNLKRLKLCSLEFCVLSIKCLHPTATLKLLFFNLDFFFPVLYLWHERGHHFWYRGEFNGTRFSGEIASGAVLLRQGGDHHRNLGRAGVWDSFFFLLNKADFWKSKYFSKTTCKKGGICLVYTCKCHLSNAGNVLVPRSKYYIR